MQIYPLLRSAVLGCGLGVVVGWAALAPITAHAQNGRWFPEDDPAPSLVLKTVDGAEVDLAAYKGRVVLLNFWATWCGPCVAEMPSLAALAKRAGDKNMVVLGVNYHESAQKVRDFAAKSGVPFPLLRDPWQEASSTWKVRVLPTTFVIDAQGAVRYRVVGEVDWLGPFAADKLRPLLASKRSVAGAAKSGASANQP